MNSSRAYESIQQWAEKLKRRLKDTDSPTERAYEIARAVADIRLSNLSYPPEPSRRALRILMLDYLQSHPDEDPGGSEDIRIGSTLESLILAVAQEKIEASEHEPYFGCHRTKDTRPPASSLHS